jgi:hypothetical protein
MMVQYEYANISKGSDRIKIDVATSGKEYYCIECNEPMYAVNKINNKQSAHFRHKSNYLICIHEGPLHLDTKFEIYDYIMYFFNKNEPLYINVTDKHGFTHQINILEHATDVNCEEWLSSKYKPDISIVGGKMKYTIEVIDTHEMSDSAIKYTVDNKINVIKIRTNDKFLKYIKELSKIKYKYIFRSTQKNVEFVLYGMNLNIYGFRNFKFFGENMYNMFSRSIRWFLYNKYELDTYMFTEKKQNEFNKCMCDVYNILNFYELDTNEFLNKCLLSQQEEDRAIQLEFRNEQIKLEKKEREWELICNEYDNVVKYYEDEVDLFNYKQQEYYYYTSIFNKLVIDNPSFITWNDERGHTFVAQPPYDPKRFYNIIESQREAVRSIPKYRRFHNTSHHNIIV